MVENGKFRTIHQHTHEKELRLSIVDKFRKVLTKKAIEKPLKTLVDIYLEETLNFTEASILYPFGSAESTMRKARAKSKHKAKPTAEDSNDPQNVYHQQLLKHFCHETLNESTVIFMHQHSLKIIGKIEEIHVDCSIRCTDEDLYLVVILAMVKSQNFPVAFGLIKNKSQENFLTFLSFIRNKSPSLCPNNILTNCDTLLQDALKITFPEATIKIMWYFYASSVLKFARETSALQCIGKSLFHKISIKMMLAIPLIPANYMIPGFDALKKWMFEKSVFEFNGICEFIDQNWTDQAEKISIFNSLSHSINNYVQNFNRDLLNGRNVEDLTKEKLIEAISKQATRAVVKINKTKGITSLKKSQKLQLTIFETAKNNWIKANIHLRRPIQFLQQVSHCIDDGMISFLLNCDEGIKANEVFKLPRTETLFSDLSSVVSPGFSLIPSEPPPLIFFNQQIQRNNVVVSDPPPLVPILRQTSENT